MGGETGNSAAGSQWGLSVANAITPTISVTVVAQAMKDNVAFGSSPSNSTTATADATTTTPTVYVPALSATYFDSSSASIMGNWKVANDTKLYAGYSTITQSNPTDAAADKLITQVQGVPINQTAYNGINVNKFQSNLKTTVAWAGVKYDLDKMNHIMAAYYLRSVGAYSAYTTNAATGAGSATAGTPALFSDNKQNIYTAMYDRDLSKQTDVYAYVILNNFDTQGGASASTTTPQSQWGTLSGLNINQYGVGMRMKF